MSRFLLNLLLTFRSLNWLTVSALLVALLTVVASIIFTTAQAPVLALDGLAITLALLALRD